MLKLIVAISDGVFAAASAGIEIKESDLELSTKDFIERFAAPTTAAALNELKQQQLTDRKS